MLFIFGNINNDQQVTVQSKVFTEVLIAFNQHFNASRGVILSRSNHGCLYIVFILRSKYQSLKINSTISLFSDYLNFLLAIKLNNTLVPSTAMTTPRDTATGILNHSTISILVPTNMSTIAKPYLSK